MLPSHVLILLLIQRLCSFLCFGLTVEIIALTCWLQLRTDAITNSGSMAYIACEYYSVYQKLEALLEPDRFYSL